MTTRAIMKTKIANELARADLDAEIGDAIATAIDFYRWKRFWFNEVESATSSTSNGVEYYDPPANFLSVDFIKGTLGGQTWPLEEQSNLLLRDYRATDANQSGRPFYWAKANAQFRLWPIPDDIYTLTWSGLLDVAPTSDSETDNPWMTYGEALIRERARAEVRINVLRAAPAIQEAAQLALAGEEALTMIEKAVHRRLSSQSRKRTNTGRIRPSTY